MLFVLFDILNLFLLQKTIPSKKEHILINTYDIIKVSLVYVFIIIKHFSTRKFNII